MICWLCHWGWPKPVQEIYDEAARRVGYEFEYGPTHIVWDDHNFDDDSIDHCLDNIGSKENIDRYGSAYLMTMQWSLLKLKKIPPEIRDDQPEDYDEEHPDLFPPTWRKEPR